MPGQNCEEEDVAPSHPSNTQTKAMHNDWTCHGEQIRKGTNAKSDPNVEKEFEKSTGMLA